MSVPRITRPIHGFPQQCTNDRLHFLTHMSLSPLPPHSLFFSFPPHWPDLPLLTSAPRIHAVTKHTQIAWVRSHLSRSLSTIEAHVSLISLRTVGHFGMKHGGMNVAETQDRQLRLLKSSCAAADASTASSRYCKLRHGGRKTVPWPFYPQSSDFQACTAMPSGNSNLSGGD